MLHSNQQIASTPKIAIPPNNHKSPSPKHHLRYRKNFFHFVTSCGKYACREGIMIHQKPRKVMKDRLNHASKKSLMLGSRLAQLATREG